MYCIYCLSICDVVCEIVPRHNNCHQQEIEGMHKCAKISVSSASPLQAQGEDGVHPSCNRARSGEESGTVRPSVGGLIHINTDNNSRSHLYLQLIHQLINLI